MDDCHHTEHVVTSPPLAAFAAPTVTVSDVPMIMRLVEALALAEPHAAPSPARPAAPS